MEWSKKKILFILISVHFTLCIDVHVSSDNLWALVQHEARLLNRYGSADGLDHIREDFLSLMPNSSIDRNVIGKTIIGLRMSLLTLQNIIECTCTKFPCTCIVWESSNSSVTHLLLRNQNSDYLRSYVVFITFT